jgi:cytoplasmic iron level regulating protein YaaA (DUF328/UPF0246 family)
MKILLSPAKSIDINTSRVINDFSTPIFLKETKFLVDKLKKLSPKKMGDLMSISKDLAELNVHRYHHFILPNEEGEDLFSAIFGFSGEVYKGFDANSLSEHQLMLAQNQIRILSGLYGILKPFDRIYPYRLEMGSKFPGNKTHKDLYTFWGEKLTNSLKRELIENEPVVNLASNEYSKAILFKKLSNPVVTPVFKEFKNGSYKIVMMYAKHARGAMARHIVRNGINEIEKIKLFNEDRYEFNASLSTESEWVFVR